MQGITRTQVHKASSYQEEIRRIDAANAAQALREAEMIRLAEDDMQEFGASKIGQRVEGDDLEHLEASQA